jgi:dCMP deaminase
VRENHIIGGGYNGAPPGMPHCLDVGCGGGEPDPGQPLDEYETNVRMVYPIGCTRSIHAELNAVAFSARHGVRTDGAAMYCTHAMCRVCAQAVASAGIVEVHYEIPYRDEAGLHLLNEAGIEVFKYGVS